MPDLVDWALAERIAVRSTGREPLAASYHWDALTPDFTELTALAEELVAAETGLVSDAGPARGVVIDREGWVRANVASFRRLLAPLGDRFGARVAGPSAVVMRSAAALEMGLLLGWMSGRVLGQYDFLLSSSPDGSPDGNPDERTEASVGTPTHVGDVVYYVGPNVLALEKRYGFPPREFRLWLALHEVTHRAQFTGVPWMRDHYLSLVDQAFSAAGLDPTTLLSTLGELVRDVRAGRSPLADGGLARVVAGPEQRAAIDRIGGLMSLLEGHGDLTMDRAGAGQVPSAERFGAVLRARRASATGISRIIQQILGIEAKLNQYEQGERFIRAVEESGGGADALEPVWRGPSWLPTLQEIQEPDEWLARVRLSEELERPGWPRSR